MTAHRCIGNPCRICHPGPWPQVAYEPGWRRGGPLDDLPMVDTSPRGEARRWRQKVEDAERTACALFQAAWPVGSNVSWQKSGPVLHGLVREHNPYGPSLWVTNAATGRTYKISHYDVLRAPVAP